MYKTIVYVSIPKSLIYICCELIQSQLPGLGLAFPVIIFGVLALVAGILMYWIPETLYAPMHQTIGEAESAKEDFGIPCCGKRDKSPRVLVPLSDGENMNEKDSELMKL